MPDKRGAAAGKTAVPGGNILKDFRFFPGRAEAAGTGMGTVPQDNKRILS